MQKTENTELGTVRIHKNVIGAIAAQAALETAGVSRLEISSNKLFGFLKRKKKGVRVEIDEGNEVKIKIFVIIKYGYHLSEVGRQVQENIRKAIDKLTDLSLREVNVDIKGVENEAVLKMGGEK